MGKWVVVIPSDSMEHLSKSIPSITTMHLGIDAHRIIVVSGTLEPDQVVKNFAMVKVVRDESPFNFSKRVNLGFKAAGDRDVVIMGDDVEVVTKKAFDLLGAEASIRLLAAPVRGRVGPWWQREGQNHAEVPFVSFTCVYLSAALRAIVGDLHEFPGYGYEDTDYCLRVRQAGLSCGVIGAAVVEHGVNIPSQFITDHAEKLVGMEEEARRAFVEKWRSFNRKDPPR